MWQRFKDWYLGGDPSDTNWRQGLSATGLFPLPGARAEMQRARAWAERLDRTRGVSQGLLIPAWLARELPPGSLVLREAEPHPGKAGRFRLWDGTWSPPIEGDREKYRIEFLPEG